MNTHTHINAHTLFSRMRLQPTLYYRSSYWQLKMCVWWLTLAVSCLLSKYKLFWVSHQSCRVALVLQFYFVCVYVCSEASQITAWTVQITCFTSQVSVGILSLTPTQPSQPCLLSDFWWLLNACIYTWFGLFFVSEFFCITCRLHVDLNTSESMCSTDVLKHPMKSEKTFVACVLALRLCIC